MKLDGDGKYRGSLQIMVVEKHMALRIVVNPRQKPPDDVVSLMG
jgi:hypothetical protein